MSPGDEGESWADRWIAKQKEIMMSGGKTSNLEACPDCGNPVSRHARACPTCGYAMAKGFMGRPGTLEYGCNMGCVSIFLILCLIVAALFGLGFCGMLIGV